MKIKFEIYKEPNLFCVFKISIFLSKIVYILNKYIKLYIIFNITHNNQKFIPIHTYYRIKRYM